PEIQDGQCDQRKDEKGWPHKISGFNHQRTQINTGKRELHLQTTTQWAGKKLAIRPAKAGTPNAFESVSIRVHPWLITPRSDSRRRGRCPDALMPGRASRAGGACACPPCACQ